MHKSRILRPLFPALLAALPWVFPGRAGAELERLPKAVGTSIDVGQIENGKIKNFDASGQAITRTGVYLTAGGIYNKRLQLSFTIGGLFWFPLPELDLSGTRIVRFGPGVGKATGIYAFGEGGAEAPRLQFGLFPVKYNPDAKNLGEYLYRSGTYPGYIWTGGWSYINSAAYLAQGLAFTWPTFGGAVVHDFTLFMERDIEPTHDLSPSYRVTLRPSRVFELGAGLEWAHGIPLKNDSVLAPRSRLNAYTKSNGMPLTLADRNKPGYAYYGPGDARNDTLIVAADDPRWHTPASLTDPNRTYITAEENGTPDNSLSYYTFRGFKASARASLNLGALFGAEEAMGRDAFKLYAEAALLGIENQPFYYDRRSERMPVMAGLNIPTFRLLDMLSLEVEYHKSRFANTVAIPFDKRLPLPLQSETEDPLRYSEDSVAANAAEFKRDDWHWSVYARRRVVEGVTVFAQVASDHLRHIDDEVKPTESPSTRFPKEWYYVVRLEFGI